MKLALITDQHFGARNDHPAILENQKKFYDNIFFPEIVKCGITNIIDLGDTFDKRKQVNISTLNSVKRFYFDRVKELDVHLDIIIGNHTSFYQNTNSVNTIDQVLGDYDNITIVSKSPIVKEYDGLELMLMPWINKENLKECLDAIQTPKGVEILLAHLEIEGFTMHSGIVCKRGMKPSIFKKFDQVYSGHFHSPSSQGNIQYLGSPYETTWADHGDAKGFHILDTDTKQLEFIHNPYNLHLKVDFDDRKSVTADMVEGSFVRVVINSPAKKTEVDEFKDFLVKSHAADVKTLDLSASKVSQKVNTLDVTSLSSTQTMISSYVDGMSDDAPKDDIKAFLNDLHKEALDS